MFIVLEGIDGAGKGRQRNEIITLLQDRVKELHTTDFPDHKSVIYKNIIHPGLHQEIELTPSALFLSFMLDQLFHQNIISECRGSKSNYFVCDGYYTTNIAYHCYVNKSLPLKDALSAARIFKMPVPDLVIYIDVAPKSALERKMLEEGHSEGLDVYERSLMFQTQVRQAFKKMAKNSVFGNWAEVDGNRSVDDIRDAIMRILLTRKLIPN